MSREPVRPPASPAALQRAAQRVALTQERDAAAARVRARRQAVVLIAVTNVLVLLVGFSAATDLRRLRTAEGTGGRWLQAAVFGDCEDYLTLSMADPARPERRSREQLCRDLRSAAKAAREDRVQFGPKLRLVARDRVQVDLTRSGATTRAVIHVIKVDGSWRVLRDAITCGSVGCA